MEAERLTHLKNIEWFQSHTYEKVIARNREIFQSFGMKESEIERAAGPRVWRQWVFHPLWSFAWADQEKLQCLKDWQKEMTSTREVVQHCSLLRLESDLARNRASYRTPFGSWRFYCSDLPLEVDEYPYPTYERAWSLTLQNLTLNEMALTAIAIKRYELRHGEEPSALSELTPEILAALPRDFMDGKQLRYLRRAKGRFILYSIGQDLRDDGGDMALGKSENPRQIPSPWAGKDWVWP
jgi:hypothetical protein